MKSQSKFLFIRTDASTQIGSGHLMRCLALAQAWKKQGGKVTFISACESESLSSCITDEGFELVQIGKSCPDPDDLVTTLSIINNQSSTNDWIVLDGYHFDTDYQQIIKNNGSPLLVIDDTVHLNHYVADIILNQNINAKDLSYSCEPETKLLLGTDYVLLRDEFLGYKNWSREIPEVARKILVTLGSGDPENMTLKVIQASNGMGIDRLEIKVVVGASNLHMDGLKEAVGKSKHKIELIQNAQNMPGLMAWADVSVSAGGSTCWELAFMGLPGILMVTADNQKEIAAGLDEYGAVINLGWFSDVSKEQIAENISILLKDAQLRTKMSQQGRELVDSNGSSRLITKMYDILENDHFHLRLVNEEDAELLWRWANEPDVRSNSFYPENIALEDHLKWFSDKLNSEATRIWILEYDDEPVGQIRYDRVNGTTAKIGFSVSKNVRGMGIGTKLLQMTYEIVLEELKVEKVKGVTFATNIASSKAFERAGFKLVGEENISNHFCNVYMK